MKKYLSILFSFAFLLSIIISPLTSSALVVYNPDPDIITVNLECVELKNNLKLLDRDINKNGEVTRLQNFLADKGYFKDSATGYFGLVTTKAVAEFQKANDIAPAIGYVGSLTRAKIKALTCELGPVCPDGYTGTYPKCVQTEKECPTGYYGKYPDCKIAICDYAAPQEGCTYVPGPNYNSLNQCGMILQCVDDVKVCPAGTTGTYPNCVQNPISSCVELSNNLILTDKDANKNGEVTKLQNFLITQGYLKESATGYFGVATLAGVIKFQKAKDINPAVGVVASLTRAKIKALTCSGENSNKPEITVTSPNGGESWKASDTAKITWTTKNAPADSWVALFLQNKEEQTQLLAQKLAVNGSYDYLVSDNFCAGDACYPDPINGDFKIIARLYTGAQELCGGYCYYEPGTRIEPSLIKEDSSDKSFKITSIVQNNCFNGLQDFGETGIDVGGSCGGLSCPEGYSGTPPICDIIPPVVTPSVTILSPNGNESYKPNEYIPIKIKTSLPVIDNNSYIMEVRLAYFPKNQTQPVFVQFKTRSAEEEIDHSNLVSNLIPLYSSYYSEDSTDKVTYKLPKKLSNFESNISIKIPARVLVNASTGDIIYNTGINSKNAPLEDNHLLEPVWYGKNFKVYTTIKKVGQNTTFLEDSSDTNFSIIPEGFVEGCNSTLSFSALSGKPCPSITFTYPKGGEKWKVGSTQEISWTTKNAPVGSSVGLSTPFGLHSLDKAPLSLNGSHSILITEKICRGIPGCIEESALNKEFEIEAYLYTGNYLPPTDVANDPNYLNNIFNKLDFDTKKTSVVLDTSTTCPTGGTGTYPNCVISTTSKPTVTLTANPDSVQSNKNITLSWSSTNATSCTASASPSTTSWGGTISNGWTGAKATSGTQVISNLQTTTTFTLTCVGGTGDKVSKSVDVGVYVVDVFPNPLCPTGTTGTYPNCIQSPVPTITFTSNPSGIEQGKSSILTWSSTNATSCTATGGWTGAKATAGSEVISNITEPTTYTLTCTGPGGGTIAQTEVNVYIVDDFKPTATVVSPNGGEVYQAGQQITVKWETKNIPSEFLPSILIYHNKAGRFALSNIVNDGVETLTLPTANDWVNMPYGDFYKIQVAFSKTGGSSDSFVYSDYSDNTFTITSTSTPVCPGGYIGTHPNCVVNTLKPVITITANPTSIQSGGSTTITWTAQNAFYCVASSKISGYIADWYGTLNPIGGTKVINNLTSNRTFGIDCINKVNDQVSGSVSVVVEPPSTKPTVTITANSTSVPSGGSATLTWTANNMSNCKSYSYPSNSNWLQGVSRNQNGSQVVSNLTNFTSFFIECNSSEGIKNASVSITTTSATPSAPITSPYFDGCTSYKGYSATTGRLCYKNDLGIEITPYVALLSSGQAYFKTLKGIWYKYPEIQTNTDTTESNLVNICNKFYSGATRTSLGGLGNVDENKDTPLYQCWDAKHVSLVLGASTEKNPNLCSLDSTLLKGMKSPQVKCLQQKLNQKGYKVVGTEGGKEHTQFGYNTMLALKKFQAENKLKADGILGLQTRALLNK